MKKLKYINSLTAQSISAA